MAANEFNLPCSLLKLAYNACNVTERKKYDRLPTLPVDLRICCKSLLRVMKLNSDVERFRPLQDRRSMFAKVQPIAQSQFGRGFIIRNICEMAAKYGHVDCMKFARAIGVPWTTSTRERKSACSMAAKRGNLECLAYAHANGVSLTKKASMFAAKNGHLDCLVYLHENGCPWDTRTCKSAAKYGHVECLNYARQNGCPWDQRTSSAAVMYGQVECIKYCREHGCPWEDQLLHIFDIFGNQNFVNYVTQYGCQLNRNSSASAVDFELTTRLMYLYQLHDRDFSVVFSFFHTPDLSIGIVRVCPDIPRARIARRRR